MALYGRFRSWVSLAVTDGLISPLRCLANTAEVNPPASANGDPYGLTEADISKIYSVPNEEVRVLYPRGLPKSFTALADTFRETSWLLRPQMFDVICQLRNSESPHSKKKFLIYGGDGCGKSLFTGQLVYWCWKAGWMVLHVPGVSFWAHSRKELRPSTYASDMYDQPQEASTWLSNFRTINGDILKSMTLSKTKVWSRRETSEQGEKLIKVIELGLHKPILATDIVGVVLQEVIEEHNRRSTSDSPEVEKFKMVLAIDEFNGCYNPCSACISKFEGVETRQLNLIKYFKDLTPVDKFPGPVVLSLSRRKLFKFFPLNTSPLDLLGKKGMKDVVGYKHIEVDNLSQIEVNTLLKYYKNKMWITREPFDQVCKEVWHLSEGNAAEVFKLSNSL